MNSKTDKIQFNGNVGSERSSSLLSERFWVLRRSVDVHGADFLVQLAETDRNFSDPFPPRLCTIQAKYSQDRKTTHEIPASYVLDEDGIARRGFFVLVHMGSNDKRICYLLSAADIKAELNHDEKRAAFKVQAGTAYQEKFRKDSDNDILDVVEKELRGLSDLDKLKFNIPWYEIKRTNLAPKWLIPIPNERGHIPDLVYRLRVTGNMLLEQNAVEHGLLADMMTEHGADEIISILGKLNDWLEESAEDVATFVGRDRNAMVEHFCRLRDAVPLHDRRYQLLLGDVKKHNAFADFHNATVRKCIEVFNTLKPRIERLGENEYRLLPVCCAITFSVKQGHSESVEVRAVDDSAPLPPLRRHQSRVDGNIFTQPDEGRISGWRDMDRLSFRACTEYFKSLFPTELVGDPQLPTIMAE